MKLQTKILLGSFLFMFPVFAHAQTTAFTIVDMLSVFVSKLVPIAIAAALLFFIWGLAIFIKNSGSEDAREEGKQKMMWGLVALFVIIAVWGIVWFIANSLRIDPRMKAPVPDIPRTSGTSGSVRTANTRTTSGGSGSASGGSTSGGGTTVSSPSGSSGGSSGGSSTNCSPLFDPHCDGYAGGR